MLTTEKLREIYVRADSAGAKDRVEYEAEFDAWLHRLENEIREER